MIYIYKYNIYISIQKQLWSWEGSSTRRMWGAARINSKVTMFYCFCWPAKFWWKAYTCPARGAVRVEVGRGFVCKDCKAATFFRQKNEENREIYMDDVVKPEVKVHLEMMEMTGEWMISIQIMQKVGSKKCSFTKKAACYNLTSVFVLLISEFVVALDITKTNDSARHVFLIKDSHQLPFTCGTDWTTWTVFHPQKMVQEAGESWLEMYLAALGLKISWCTAFAFESFDQFSKLTKCLTCVWETHAMRCVPNDDHLTWFECFYIICMWLLVTMSTENQ